MPASTGQRGGGGRSGRGPHAGGVSKHYNHTAQKIHHCPQRFSLNKHTQRVSRRGQEGDGAGRGDRDEADSVVLVAGAGGAPALAPVLALTQNLLLRKLFA